MTLIFFVGVADLPALRCLVTGTLGMYNLSSSFGQHRQLLPLDHPFRQDKKNFTKGLVVTQPPPQLLTGAEVRAQVEALVANEGGGRYVGYGEKHMWSHKSGLQRLPYHDDLLVPHHIDFMHTEKNIVEAIFAHSWTPISLRITLRP
jgi:hypothetical protein